MSCYWAIPLNLQLRPQLLVKGVFINRERGNHSRQKSLTVAFSGLCPGVVLEWQPQDTIWTVSTSRRSPTGEPVTIGRWAKLHCNDFRRSASAAGRHAAPLVIGLSLVRIRASESDTNSARPLGQPHLSFSWLRPRGVDLAQHKGDGQREGKAPRGYCPAWCEWPELSVLA